MADERKAAWHERRPRLPASDGGPVEGGNGPDPVAAMFAAENVLALVLVGLALATILSFAPGGVNPSLEYFGLAALMIQWVLALSLGVLHLLRKALARRPITWLLAFLLAVMSLITWLSAVVGWWLLVGPDQAGLFGFLLQSTAIAWSLAAAGAALLVNATRWQQLRSELQRAQLQHLQARVRPHFLFNALNTATALLPDRPDQAEQVLLDLSDLFRAALRDAALHPLSEELALARRYLDIEALRLGPRLRIDWVEPQTPPLLAVPAFCVQALVENAVRHGIEPEPSGGWIDVRVAVLAQAVEVVLRNSIPGPGAGRNRAAGGGIGVAGTRTRLTALLGASARLEAAIVDGVYQARLHLPRPDHPTTR